MSLLVVATHGCGANNGYGLFMAQESTALVRTCVQPATVLAVLTCFLQTINIWKTKAYAFNGLGFRV